MVYFSKINKLFLLSFYSKILFISISAYSLSCYHYNNILLLQHLIIIIPIFFLSTCLLINTSFFLEKILYVYKVFI